MKLYVFDVDGTLTRQDFNIDDLESLEPNAPIVSLALHYQNQKGSAIAIATARDESLRERTENWLSKHKLKAARVLMRGLKDNRPDPELKVDEIRKLKYEFGNVEIFYDDKPENCKAVREMEGVKCVLVNAKKGSQQLETSDTGD